MSLDYSKIKVGDEVRLKPIAFAEMQSSGINTDLNQDDTLTVSMISGMAGKVTNSLTIIGLKESDPHKNKEFTCIMDDIEEHIIPIKATSKKTTTKKPKKMDKNKIIGQKDNISALEVSAKNNIPALLIGQTGTGKTSLIRQLAKDHNKEYVRFNMTGETTVDEFVGKFILKSGKNGSKTVWTDGILLDAMKSGKWLVVDEINVALPEILFVLHSLLDDDKSVTVAQNDNEVVKAHKDFRFYATMNPVEEYAGTKELNKAFQSRFGMVLEVDYADKKDEISIIEGKSGISMEEATFMVDVAFELRNEKASESIEYMCSTRDLIQWGDLIKFMGIKKMTRAFELAILNKANNDDKEILTDKYNTINKKYEKVQKIVIDKGLSIDDLDKKIEELSDIKKSIDKKKEELKKEIAESITAKLGSIEYTGETERIF